MIMTSSESRNIVIFADRSLFLASDVSTSDAHMNIASADFWTIRKILELLWRSTGKDYLPDTRHNKKATKRNMIHR